MVIRIYKLGLSYSSMLIINTDGCPDEVTECGSVGSVMWPETELGQTVELPCPCGVPSVFGFLNLVATRQCRGNYLNGGIWNDPDCSNCNLAGTTQSLCELSNVSSIIYRLTIYVYTIECIFT